MLPIWLTVNILTERIGDAIQNSNRIISAINTFIGKIELRFNFSIMKGINPSSISGFVANSLRSILTSTVNSLTSVMLMYFILYFMLIGTKEMEAWVYNFIPLKKENVRSLGKEMKSLVISNALGIPLVAVLQGVVGLIAYIFLGVDDVWFWFIFTCISSMIPFIGAALA
jgi:predicted PurR-regulated permease PerM